MPEECVRKALALLVKAGRMDLVRQEALGPLRPARCGGVWRRGTRQAECGSGTLAGAAGRIPSAGVRTGWRKAADAPKGRCGGMGFTPTGAAVSGSSVRDHQVCGR
ncbi:hypothetical protein NDU88_003633 [Pleurodeles waltl]|uniref:Uncharacterized protein n=1 Tax=Pleurodeles waltl TaxID=8319 RepID=A0AAV7QAL3_PLEWA|nr:hypothetical protein NDU88_003633 [Pleurodeles waltl]